MFSKNPRENFLPLPRNRQNTERISLSYNVNDHIYLKSNPSNFVRIKPTSKLYTDFD